MRVRFIGDLSAFSPELQEKVRQAETQTRDNERMTLNVAANYGGRWDIVNAARLLAAEVASGRMQVEQIDEPAFGARLALAGGGDPDLFIRTGGEMRISNFLLWQCAYTEFYFAPELWPDFTPQCLDAAIAANATRERRFGHTSGQVRRQASKG